MKIAKLTGLFALGFLAVLLAGCFNPITAISPTAGDPPADSFTMDIIIGQDGQARTVAGPNNARIQAGLYNFIQLIVVDNANQTIAAFDEIRRQSIDDTTAELSITSIEFGRTYDFLILMGYWEHDGSYNYADNASPTLLAAGFREQVVSGSGTITVTLWPIVADTKFTAAGQSAAEPTVTNGQPGTVELLPVGWNVTWLVSTRTKSEAPYTLLDTPPNGFARLIQAQQVVHGSESTDLLLKSKSAIVRGAGLEDFTATDELTLSGNTLTLDIEGYTKGFGRIKKEGSVNFRLEYVPFHLTVQDEENPWTGFDNDSYFNLAGENLPVWIIRNGINDSAQNADTDFAKFNTDAGYNGNGAVSFKGAVRQNNALVITNKELKDAGSNTPKIKFTTSGYTGNAEVWYAVVTANAPAPDYPDYYAYSSTKLGSVGPGTTPQLQIKLPGSGVGTDGYDVYVVLFKDGELSAPLKIKTKEGDIKIEIPWGS